MLFTENELTKTNERITDISIVILVFLFDKHSSVWSGLTNQGVAHGDNKENVEHASKYLSSQ